MKSKMKIKMKIAGKLWGLSAILLFVSCAKGFDDNETFSGGVTNAQLESPVIDDNSFSTLTNSDGTESVKITWPVVMGAGGYLLNVDLIEDPADPTVTTENPVVVMQDSVVDGSSVVFTKTEFNAGLGLPVFRGRINIGIFYDRLRLKKEILNRDVIGATLSLTLGEIFYRGKLK